MVLHDYRYQVVTAPSLEEALSLVDQQAFGFILSDLMVRGAGDQLQAVERLRERAFPTPIGIMTGWKLPQAAIDGRGFAWLMRKPFDVDLLVTEIAVGLETPLTPAQERRAEVVRAISRRSRAATGTSWSRCAAPT
jgi:DNA-binding response OmpR family regulator